MRSVTFWVRQGRRTSPPEIALARPKPARRSLSPMFLFYARSASMMDIIVLLIGIVFFALSLAYVYACDLL
jgi:hypothetical protein